MNVEDAGEERLSTDMTSSNIDIIDNGTTVVIITNASSSVYSAILESIRLLYCH